MVALQSHTASRYGDEFPWGLAAGEQLSVDGEIRTEFVSAMEKEL
jgi:hypothetical protein